MNRVWKTIYSSAVVLFSAAALLAQMGDVRGLVERTQSDLRRAQEFERHNGKEVARYDNALRHLSDFDKQLTRGHFDKGKLDTAIDDVKNVVEHNTLDPRMRDNLGNDLRDLRVMRADRGHR
jgi:hypothetical protein